MYTFIHVKNVCIKRFSPLRCIYRRILIFFNGNYELMHFGIGRPKYPSVNLLGGTRSNTILIGWPFSQHDWTRKKTVLLHTLYTATSTKQEFVSICQNSLISLYTILLYKVYIINVFLLRALKIWTN